MSRAHIIYGLTMPSTRATGFNPDEPVEGYYRMRLRFGGVQVGIRIWYGPPLDPVTGEEMDRGWRWQATANGHPADLERVWPRCAGDPVDQAEHDYLVSLQRWGEQHAPESAIADPTQRVDLNRAPLPI